MDYSHALGVATAAAKQAGALLREEFHRPRGPRGHGGHAPVDAEAETVIRDALEVAFPPYGVRGEELGRRTRVPRDVDQHCWLIDPNDGTRSFLRGDRGAAVSIALLRDGKPVLGVVYAYAAPDDDGDLFAWAEGCGPLTRNGRPVERALFALELGPEHTVFVSQDADRAALANAELCAPGRFRAVPSIAYRLALVAAGEGEIAVSLNGPVGWDYAAGHALLRGVGCGLVDRHGRPITYTVEGHSSCHGRCFGGSPALAKELASRPWHLAVREQRAASPSRRLWPRYAVSNAGVLARAQGCLLGQLAGDALGSLVEFQPPNRIAAAYPDGGPHALDDGGTWNTIAGQPTDDSELALALARSLAAHGRFDDEVVAEAYGGWYASGPFDVGSTTSRALSAASGASRDPEASVASAARDAARAGSSNSLANGALMRVSPLGIFGWKLDADELADLGRRDASLTHPHPVCEDGSAVFTVAIATAIREGLPPRDLYDRVVSWALDRGLHADVLETLERAAVEPPADYMTNMGWVLIALQNAFFKLLHAPSLEEGVVDTVRRGGDTDTNGAIAGALLGAVHGRDAIPAQWRDRVLSCRPMKGLAGVRQPRPEEYWPVDLEVLAERLLLASSTPISRTPF